MISAQESFPLLMVLGLALWLNRPADRLRYDPGPEEAVTVLLTSELRLHYERARTRIDGRDEDVVAQVPQARDSLLRSSLRFSERVPKTRAGRALEIERRYLGWSQEDELGTLLSRGGLRQLLVDRQLKFRWDGQGWERTLQPRAESEQAPAATDPSTSELQELAVELDFRALLPDGEVQRDDRWTVSPDFLGSLLAPGLSAESWSRTAQVEASSPLDDDSMRIAMRAWLERLESEGPRVQCVYLGRNPTGEGARVEVGFSLEREDLFEADAAARAAALRDIEEGKAVFRRFDHRVTTEVQGQLHWDLEARRFARLEAHASSRITRSLDLTLEARGKTSELGSLQVFRVELDVLATAE